MPDIKKITPIKIESILGMFLNSIDLKSLSSFEL